MLDQSNRASAPSTDLAERRRRFRERVAQRDAQLVPGVANALTARIVEDLGFEAVYLTGAGLTNTQLGMPDLGLITATEVAEAATRISDACDLPLIVDVDTGFGNALNVFRTVGMLERAGACALQIEDQVFPKKCGHFSDKAVVPLAEMVSKVKAALDARRDPNLQIIARTDARAIEGIEGALDRAHALIEAGADVLFVEAPETRDEIRRIGRLPAPQVINLVIGGRTPIVSLEEARADGFSLVLYANAALQATVTAVQDVLGRLKSTGSLDAGAPVASFTERQRVVRKELFDDRERRYRGS